MKTTFWMYIPNLIIAVICYVIGSYQINTNEYWTSIPWFALFIFNITAVFFIQLWIMKYKQDVIIEQQEKEVETLKNLVGNQKVLVDLQSGISENQKIIIGTQKEMIDLQNGISENQKLIAEKVNKKEFKGLLVTE